MYIQIIIFGGLSGTLLKFNYWIIYLRMLMQLCTFTKDKLVTSFHPSHRHCDSCLSEFRTNIKVLEQNCDIVVTIMYGTVWSNQCSMERGNNWLDFERSTSNISRNIVQYCTGTSTVCIVYRLMMQGWNERDIYRYSHAGTLVGEGGSMWELPDQILHQPGRGNNKVKKNLNKILYKNVCNKFLS